MPRLLRRAAPEAKLLLSLRDPVERFRSGIAHLERMGAPRDPTAVADAVQRGFYHRTLVSWLTEFDRDQLLVLQHERCIVDRDGELDRTYRHLGLDPHHHPPGGRPPTNAASPGGFRLDGEVRARLVELYEPDVTALAALLPDLELGRWPNFAYLAPGSGSRGATAEGNSPTERA